MCVCARSVHWVDQIVMPRTLQMPDLVRNGESGRLVPPDNPAALADALVALLSDPAQCRRLGERGCEIAREHYSWDAVGDKVRAGILADLAKTSA